MSKLKRYKWYFGAAIFSAATLLGMGLPACDSDDGPAEELGEKIDEGVEEVGEDLEEAGDEIEEAGDELEDDLEE
ncbi:MAG: hypothetical protein R3236_05700 [Phycisphaeraceae bacterium]|nr:hypothetical protein [Phycisphaeraceae bacterium]